MKFFFPSGLFVLLLSLSARGEVVFSDTFAYGDGSLITTSGFVWNTHSGTTGQIQVISGKVQLLQSQSEDVNATLTGGPYSSNNLYASFSVNFSSLPSGPLGNYFLHLKDGGMANLRGRVFATTNSAAKNMFRVGVANASNTSTNVPVDLALNTDYTLVMRYSNSAASVTTLWLNPASESSAHRVDATDASGPIQISTIVLRQSLSSPNGMGMLLLDDLKVGTNFSDVLVPLIPPSITTQPQDRIVNESANLSFTVAASGSEPLFYQWKFNGTNISHGTSNTLTLANVTAADAGAYTVEVSNSAGSTNSVQATLTVNDLLIVLQYNAKGNSATNWSTNTPQVQALARVVQHLHPDVVAFNEIPYALRYQMTNFVRAFLPGYSLAISNGGDNYITSAIVSRYPITRFRKWLDGADLDPWGYTNTDFTRDLFEAEINVPGWTRPFHAFTTHLKSSITGYADAANKRAAEAAAITNFFATNFFVLYPDHPFTLSGDMNEEDTNTLAIQRLVSPFMGTHITHPVNPVTGSGDTWSIQEGLNSRLDYIFPCALLASNISSGQVFRSDRLNPLPPNLFSNDCRVASDHLPVLLMFKNPYSTPDYRISSFTFSNQNATFRWETVTNRSYAIEGSSNLTAWSAFAGTFLATGTNLIVTTNIPAGMRFFRISRLP